MSESIVFISHNKIKTGQLELLRELLADVTDRRPVSKAQIVMLATLERLAARLTNTIGFSTENDF